MFKDLREFIATLEKSGELKRITTQVDPYLEITEICDRTLRAEGPALLFENPKGYAMPVLGNLFGTPKRVALAMGQQDVAALRDVGKLLAFLKEPDPPKGWRDLLDKAPIFKQALNMAPKIISRPPCQEVVLEGDAVDLDTFPIQTCWPEDVAPLMTWPLVITRGPLKERQNLGIYRMQKIGKNRLIMRWLSHRGGALDFRDWQQQHPGEAFPVAVALGADPATAARSGLLQQLLSVQAGLDALRKVDLLLGGQQRGHADLVQVEPHQVRVAGVVRPAPPPLDGQRFGAHSLAFGCRDVLLPHQLLLPAPRSRMRFAYG